MPGACVREGEAEGDLPDLPDLFPQGKLARFAKSQTEALLSAE